MRNEGVQMTCDRCKCTQFSNKVVKNGTYEVNNVEFAGWAKRINNDLCPECVEAFDKMVNDFMNFMDCKEE